MTAPRKGDDLLAAALGVSPKRAAELRRLLGSGEAFAEADAVVRAEAALADLDAARSIDDADITEAAEDAEPLEALGRIVAGRSDRELQARLAAHVSWSKTEDPAERTRPAREALQARFERDVDPDGVLPLAERQRRADHARKAHYLRMARKSAEVRKAKKGRKEST